MVLSDILSPAYILLDSSIFNCRWSVDRICIQSSIKSVIAVTIDFSVPSENRDPTGKKSLAPRRARGIDLARSGWGTHVSAPDNQPTDRGIVPDKEGPLSTSPLPSPMEGLDVLLFDRLLWDEWDGTRDLGSRLFGVFPRRERQRDERSLVLAADAGAPDVARQLQSRIERVLDQAIALSGNPRLTGKS
jgi:hypothetical protein